MARRWFMAGQVCVEQAMSLLDSLTIKYRKGNCEHGMDINHICTQCDLVPVPPLDSDLRENILKELLLCSLLPNRYRLDWTAEKIFFLACRYDRTIDNLTSEVKRLKKERRLLQEENEEMGREITAWSEEALGITEA
jgi:hypothetical protein